eukprot:scaffold57994_cov35-Tisochrysis_lutea.AAC.4
MRPPYVWHVEVAGPQAVGSDRRAHAQCSPRLAAAPHHLISLSCRHLLFRTARPAEHRPSLCASTADARRSSFRASKASPSSRRRNRDSRVSHVTCTPCFRRQPSGEECSGHAASLRVSP